MARVLLGDVARERKEQCKVDRDRYLAVGLEHLVPQEVKLTEWSEGTENTFTKMFRKGDVLFGRRRAYLKKAAVASFDGICSGDITVIQAIPHKILPELLPFVIQNETFFDFAVGGSAGSLSPRVKWEHLRNYEFELPNEEKQRELAEVLWAIYDTLEAYKKLLVKTDELVKARFVEMFDLQNDYCIVAIKELVDRNIQKVKDVFQSQDTIKYIDISSIDNIEKKMIGFSEYQVEDAPSRAQQVLSQGDILVSTVRPNLKNMAINLYEDKNVVASTGFCVLRCHKCLPEYMWGIVSSDIFTKAMCERASGISYPAVRDKDILEYQVANPPLEEQTQFAAFVHQTDKSKQELKQAITDLEATYKQILFDNLT